MPTTNGMTGVARRYLEGRHARLWAHFDLSDECGFENAVAWLADVLAKAFRPEPDLAFFTHNAISQDE